MKLIPAFVTHPELPGVKLAAFVQEHDATGPQPVQPYFAFNTMIEWLGMLETNHFGWQYSSIAKRFTWWPSGIGVTKEDPRYRSQSIREIDGLKVWPADTNFVVVGIGV